MRDFVWLALVLGGISYVAAAVLYLVALFRRRSAAFELRWAPRVLAAGGIAHFAHLVMDSLVLRRCPVFSLYSGLSLAAVVAVLAYLALVRGQRLGAVGASVAASAFAFLVGSHWTNAHEIGSVDRWLLALHITANLLGLGVLLVAGVASAFYLVHEHRLKAKRLGSLGRNLPPLDALDEVVHRLLWFGMPLLTLGVVSGMVIISRASVVTPGETLRAAISWLSWLLVAGVWGLRQLRSWRGRRPAYATLAGTGCVLVVVALYVLRSLWGGAS
jgi:ABC-type uncharacterized transport system permease subunit